MCANVRECPANVRECVRMCANAAVYLRECLRMCRECAKMLPRMFANVRVFVANVCESMPYLRMKLVTSAVQSAAAAQPQPPAAAPKLPGPIEQVEWITPSLSAALSCHHTAAVGHHVHMGTAQARRGVGRARGGQRVRTLCSAPPRPKHCPSRATVSGRCDVGAEAPAAHDARSVMWAG